MKSLIKAEKIVITKENLYLIAFSLYLFQAFLKTTMFIYKIPKLSFILNSLSYLAIGLVIIKILLDTYRKKEIIGFFIIIIAFFISMIESSYKVLLTIIIFIIGARQVSLKKMVKIYFYLSTVLLIITVISAKIGIIENLTYYRLDGTTRQSFGIRYPTDFAAQIFFIVLSFLYLKQGNIKVYHYIVIFGITYLVYKFCDARLDCASIIIALIITFLYDKGILKLKSKLTKNILIMGFIICSMIALVLTLNYERNNYFYNTLNEFLNGRLSIGKRMMEEYGITLLGQEVNDYGASIPGIIEHDEYNFIDSSYLRILLKYGLLIFTILCIVNVLINRKIYEKDKFLLLIILIIYINSIVAQHYMEITYNFLLFMYFTKIDSVEKLYKNKEKERIKLDNNRTLKFNNLY